MVTGCGAVGDGGGDDENPADGWQEAAQHSQSARNREVEEKMKGQRPLV